MISGVNGTSLHTLVIFLFQVSLPPAAWSANLLLSDLLIGVLVSVLVTLLVLVVFNLYSLIDWVSVCGGGGGCITCGGGDGIGLYFGGGTLISCGGGDGIGLL